jgi:transposase
MWCDTASSGKRFRQTSRRTRRCTPSSTLLALLRERFSTISLIWADGGYAGRLVTWAATVLGLTVTVVKRTDDLAGFVVLPRRWVVERSFGWLMRHRRLVRDYERKIEHHEAMIWWATVAIMTRRLTRELAGAPPELRWGGERQPTPPLLDRQPEIPLSAGA